MDQLMNPQQGPHNRGQLMGLLMGKLMGVIFKIYNSKYLFYLIIKDI